MLETIITLLLQAIAFGLVYYFATWVASRKFKKEIDELNEKVETHEKAMWQLRAILAGKGYGVLGYDGESVTHSYVATDKSPAFRTKYYSKDNEDAPCSTDTKDEDSCD